MQHKIGNYIRVSTEEQAMRTEGSLDSQKHRLSGYVDIKNMQSSGWGKIVEHYIDDGFSAKDTNRPALQRLFKDIKNGKINTVLVTDISRLSRSIRDFCVIIDLFKDSKIKFLSLKEQFDTTTAAGEMMLFSMINLAQFERRQISERVSINFHSRAMRGLRNGGRAPLGFKIDPLNKAILHICDDEIEFVKQIFNTYIIEGSLYKTAAILRQISIPTRSADVPWSSQTVASTLQNFSYAGLKEVNKGNKNKDQTELAAHEKYQVVKAAWPAIIDETTFYTVQDMMKENAKKERKRLSKSENRVFHLSGFISCGECGRSLVGLTAHGRSNKFRYYVHRPLEGKEIQCSVKNFSADKIEDAIINHLLKVVEREGHLDGLCEELNDVLSSEKNFLSHQKREFEKTISQLDSDIKNLIRVQIQTEDKDMHELYTDQLKDMKNQRQLVTRQLEKARESFDGVADVKAMREVVEMNLKNLQRAWSKSSKALQKKLLESVIKRLVIHVDSIDLFYQSYKVNAVAETIILKDQSTGKEPVDLASFRLSHKNKKPVLSHNEKNTGSFVVKVGCGGQI